MEFSQLRIFQAVAEEGSITRAAERLHRVPSNLSTRLKQMEEQLGVELFVRERQRLQLSPAGKVLLDYSTRLLALHDEAHGAVQGGQPAGDFVLGSMYSTAAIHLPKLLARYHKAYPMVNLQVQSAPSGELLEGLITGRLDAALVDLSQSFEEGMGYVALSRVRSLAGLYLKGLNEMALQVNREVLEFDKKFRELSRVSTVHIQTMGQSKIDKMHQEFADKVRGIVGPKKKKKKPDTLTETKNLLENGFGIKEIATMRGLGEETIVNHLTDLKKKGLIKPKDLEHIKKTIPLSKFRAISAAFHKVGVAEGDSGYRLSPAKNLLGSKYSYSDLQLIRLFL